MKVPRSVLVILFAVAAGSVGLAAVAGGSTKAHTQRSKLPTIVIGSVNFTEANIVADLYGDVLKHAGYSVQIKNNLGTRTEVVPALEHGALDIEPDYAGSLLLYLNTKAGSTANQISTAVPALKRLLGPKGATVLNASNALDTNVFAVTKATANKYHLTTLSSLKPYASKLVLGGPSECPTYALCEPGLEKVYGLHFKSFVSTDESGPISVAALKDGRAQVVEFFSSDGNIVENHFVQLTDNKHLQAADYVIPVIRKSFDVSGVANAINALSAKLTTSQLSQLNIDVNVHHESATTAAAAWAKSEGLT
ncbi:MAG: ABC transporter substrate-binding protein [Acidimicrobiales bacterium]